MTHYDMKCLKVLENTENKIFTPLIGTMRRVTLLKKLLILLLMNLPKNISEMFKIRPM